MIAKDLKDVPLKKRWRISIGDLFYNPKKVAAGSGAGFRAFVYHSVTARPVDNEWAEETISKEAFDWQMGYLTDHKYNVISAGEAVRYLTLGKTMPPRAVVITFDDGYRDNYTNAFPVLKKYNFPATVFLTADFLRDRSADERALSISEVKDMKRSGIIDFGCHGMTHRALTQLDEARLEEEITGSRKRLADILGEAPGLFAYPFGHVGSYNKGVIEKVKAAGFSGAYTAIFGSNSVGLDPFLMRRNRISWLDTRDEFAKHLAGAYDWYALYQRFGAKRYHFDGGRRGE
ncbi:MAG: polysaccharide deacetylase family protein [Candidatus Omnitrophota bacterium]